MKRRKKMGFLLKTERELQKNAIQQTSDCLWWRKTPTRPGGTVGRLFTSASMKKSLSNQ